MFRNWTMIIIGCLILGFQNCGRNGFGPDSSSNSVSQVNTGEVVDGSSDESSTSPVTALEIPTANGPLTVQVDTGKITLIDGQNQVIEQGCLSQKDLADLQSFTKDYNLCSAPAPAADTLCTADYTKGYASLIVDDQKMNLGESFDGCHKGFKDFCGSQAESFRGLVDYIATNFPSMKCN